MSFSSSIPGPNDDPTVSQGELLANFGKLNSDFGTNHQDFTSANNPGYHTKIQFPTGLGADPDLADPISSLYTKLVSGVAELFFQNNSTSGDVVQLTNLTVNSTGTNYSINTPWNMKIRMGETTGGTATFDDPFNAGTFVPLCAILTGIAASNPRVTGFTATGLTYTPTSTVYYFVLGQD